MSDTIVAGMFAQQSATPPYYHVGLAALIVALIVGVVWAYRSWEEAHEELAPATKDELMEAFRQARREGELDDQELARIRSRLETDPTVGGSGRPGPRQGPKGDVN